MPPGFAGHLPGNGRRYGVSYGASALKAWTTKEPKTPGVYREVTIPKATKEGGSYPGHVVSLTQIADGTFTQPGLSRPASAIGSHDGSGAATPSMRVPWDQDDANAQVT